MSTKSKYAQAKNAKADSIRRGGLLAGTAGAASWVIGAANAALGNAGVAALGFVGGVSAMKHGSNKIREARQLNAKANAIDALIAKSQGKPAIAAARHGLDDKSFGPVKPNEAAVTQRVGSTTADTTRSTYGTVRENSRSAANAKNARQFLWGATNSVVGGAATALGSPVVGTALIGIGATQMAAAKSNMNRSARHKAQISAIDSLIARSQGKSAIPVARQIVGDAPLRSAKPNAAARGGAPSQPPKAPPQPGKGKSDAPVRGRLSSDQQQQMATANSRYQTPPAAGGHTQQNDGKKRGWSNEARVAASIARGDKNVAYDGDPEKGKR